MLDSGMVVRYYTYNAYHYFFNDEQAVGVGVLAGLNPSDQPTVYQDPNLGMNTIDGLNWWIKASAEQNDTIKFLIQDYFLLTYNIDISNE